MNENSDAYIKKQIEALELMKAQLEKENKGEKSNPEDEEKRRQAEVDANIAWDSYVMNEESDSYFLNRH